MADLLASPGAIAGEALTRHAVRRVAVLPPLLALAASLPILPLEPRLALLPTAVLLGWSQLVGL